MIDLYTWTTPNGRKVPILLEELGLPYRLKPVDLGKDEQLRPAYLAISPNNKIPAMVDPDADGGPLSIFESGAILTYLADRHGRFLAPSGAARWKTLEWLFWGIGGLGPMLGQLYYFGSRAPEKAPLAISRFTDEAARLLGVLDRRLAEAEYLGGDYSIADMSAYPWVAFATGFIEGDLADRWADMTHARRWLDAVGARPAVQRGMAVLQA